jgi:hypothetical protein
VKIALLFVTDKENLRFRLNAESGSRREDVIELDGIGYDKIGWDRIREDWM